MTIKNKLVALLGVVAFSTIVSFVGDNSAEASTVWEERTVEEIKQDLLETDGEQVYTVKWGDTLGNISEALEIELDTLAGINDIGNKDLIRVNSKISFSKEEQVITFEDEQAEEVDTYDISDKEEPVEVVEEPTQEPNQEQESIEEPVEVVEEPVQSTSSSVPYYVYQVVESEAGEGYAEKANVMSVIVNRVNASAWQGDSYMDIVTAPGQFEVTWNGMADSAVPTDETIQAVNSVVSGNITTSADSFHASGDGITNVFHHSGN